MNTNSTEHDTENTSEVQVYTVTEVAALLRCQRATVYRIIEKGDLRAVRLGKGLRVTQAAINQFLGEA